MRSINKQKLIKLFLNFLITFSINNSFIYKYKNILGKFKEKIRLDESLTFEKQMNSSFFLLLVCIM